MGCCDAKIFYDRFWVLLGVCCRSQRQKLFWVNKENTNKKKIIPHKIWITEKFVEWRDNSGIRVSSYIISFIVFLLSMSRLNYSFLGQKIQLLNNCKIELEYCSTFEAAKKPVYYTKFYYTLYILQTNHR